MVTAIVFAGVLIGIQTYPKYYNNSTLDSCDWAVQAVFTLDCTFRILAEGVHPSRYW